MNYSACVIAWFSVIMLFEDIIYWRRGYFLINNNQIPERSANFFSSYHKQLLPLEKVFIRFFAVVAGMVYNCHTCEKFKPEQNFRLQSTSAPTTMSINQNVQGINSFSTGCNHQVFWELILWIRDIKIYGKSTYISSEFGGWSDTADVERWCNFWLCPYWGGMEL